MLEIHLSMIEEQINAILRLLPLIAKLYMTLFFFATGLDFFTTGRWGPLGRVFKSCIYFAMWLVIWASGKRPKDYGLSYDFGPDEEKIIDEMIEEWKGGKEQ